MFDAILCLLPLTGVFGGSLFLSNMQVYKIRYGIQYPNPLESKGIFDPVQKTKISILFILVDLFWKFNVCCWVNSILLSEDKLILISCLSFFVSIVIFFAIYLLCKILLPQINIRSIRKTSKYINYTRRGIVLSVLFLIDFILSSIIQYFTCWFSNVIISFVCILIISILSIVFIFTPYNILKRYDTIKRESDRTISSLKTHRSPILFLRSFQIDKYVYKRQTFDEYICNAFSMTSQPIISLSDPDDFLPTGGSIKIQSLDDNWKEAIITLFKTCRAVVIFEGKSEGLQWEIQKLKQYIPSDKLFVATPPEMYRKLAWCPIKTNKEIKYTLNKIWTDFAAHLSKEGIYVPLTNPGSDIIFSFNKNWETTNNNVRYSGMELFNYILDNTVKYENTECDYQELAKTLSSYELSLQMTNDDIRKINNAISLITLIIFAIIICIIILI